MKCKQELTTNAPKYMKCLNNNPLFNIKNTPDYAILQQRFNGWPDFHDSEILKLSLKRSKKISGIGPVLSLVVHASNVQYAKDDPRRNYSYVTLRFHDVDRLKLEEFNYQNVINYLTLSSIKKISPQGQRTRVELGGGFGISCSFCCAQIEVASVVAAPPIS